MWKWRAQKRMEKQCGILNWIGLCVNLGSFSHPKLSLTLASCVSGLAKTCPLLEEKFSRHPGFTGVHWPTLHPHPALHLPCRSSSINTCWTECLSHSSHSEMPSVTRPFTFQLMSNLHIRVGFRRQQITRDKAGSIQSIRHVLFYSNSLHIGIPSTVCRIYGSLL